MWRKLAN